LLSLDAAVTITNKHKIVNKPNLIKVVLCLLTRFVFTGYSYSSIKAKQVMANLPQLDIEILTIYRLHLDFKLFVLDLTHLNVFADNLSLNLSAQSNTLFMFFVSHQYYVTYVLQECVILNYL
jgi:hypothetical protein